MKPKVKPGENVFTYKGAIYVRPVGRDIVLLEVKGCEGMTFGPMLGDLVPEGFYGCTLTMTQLDPAKIEALQQPQLPYDPPP